MNTLSQALLAPFFFAYFLVAPVDGHRAHNTVNKPAANVVTSKRNAISHKAILLYDSLKLDSFGLTRKAFEYAYRGYTYLQEKGMLANSAVLSICDFSKSSRVKRFFVVDLEQAKLLISTYVAHGRKSGSEYARLFSNRTNSHMSSLGFYVTETPYVGSNGLSLRIEGLEKGFNDKADRRNIVIHGSEYVGEDFIRNNPFTGRSYGCPAVPATEIDEVINTIKGGSCLFIYHPTKNYIAHSRILNS
jgi:hypothetical protein